MMATVSPVENGNNNRSIHGFLDANVYATKKSIAQGMLDVALLTANASQLKYLLQILVGAFIVLVGTVNLNKEKNHFRANVLNNMVTIFIFMITVINIIISAFGLGE
ncbi:ninjurin-2-like isoform X5 [Varroa jacobsoni]|uniref:ninjurin-2-like isoform X5 n=1 Tax=Varroa jacobsoni TaxID=62625 RepID=UPI000BF5987B|nr:ninjurin-2-like isoform X5 [Varroa jacobsoni]